MWPKLQTWAVSGQPPLGILHPFLYRLHGVDVLVLFKQGVILVRLLEVWDAQSDSLGLPAQGLLHPGPLAKS